MVEFVEKKDIIMLKEQGLSNREISRRTGKNHKTIQVTMGEYVLV